MGLGHVSLGENVEVQAAEATNGLVAGLELKVA
jgi:hypothetical protein